MNAKLTLKYCTTILAAAILTACGSSKNAVMDTISIPAAKQSETVKKPATPAAQNAVASIEFTLDAMNKNVSVDGKLQMRRDKVIRLTLSAPLLGFEVGRLEFTPTEAMLVDRINRQYVKANYSDISFLTNNGLDFFTLQSLFWGERDALPKGFFSINGDVISYTKDGAQFDWKYDNFTTLNKQSFPGSHTLSFVSKSVAKGKKMTVNIKLGKVSDNSSWEETTTLSSKFKQVNAEDILKKLISL